MTARGGASAAVLATLVACRAFDSVEEPTAVEVGSDTRDAGSSGPCSAPRARLADDNFEDRPGPTDVTGKLWSLVDGDKGTAAIAFPGPDVSTKALAITATSSGDRLPQIEAKLPLTGRAGLRVSARVRLPDIAYTRFAEIIVDGAFFALAVDKGSFVLQVPDDYAITESRVPAGWADVQLDLCFGRYARLLVGGVTVADAPWTPTKTPMEVIVTFGPNTGGVAGANKRFLYDDIIVE